MPEKVENNRERIISVARRLFYQKGYAATSVGDVAAEAGVQKGNLTYYFATRRDLLLAVNEARINDIRHRLEEWSLSCGTTFDCVDRFIQMIERSADELSQWGCPMGTLNAEVGKLDPELQVETRRMFQLFHRWLSARFSALMPEAEANDCAEHLLTLAEGAAVMAHANRDSGLIARRAVAMRSWLRSVCDAAKAASEASD